MRYLLDINVWIALFDDAHTHSGIANAFISKRGLKIATCPIIENGVIRILNTPQYSRRGAVGFERVRAQLATACATLNHEFWVDDISFRDAAHFEVSKLHGHNQITDAYLLALAAAHGGALVTFDQSVALSVAKMAKSTNLLVLS